MEELLDLVAEAWGRLSVVMELQPWWRLVTLGATLGSLATYLAWLRVDARRLQRVREQMRREAAERVTERLQGS